MIHCMIKRCPKTFQLLWNQNSNILCIINTRARTIFSVQDYDKDFKVPPSNLKLDFRFATSSLSTAAGWVEGFPSKIFIVLRRTVARLLLCIMRSQVKWLVPGQVIGAICLLLHTAALASHSPLLQQFVPHRDCTSHSLCLTEILPHTVCASNSLCLTQLTMHTADNAHSRCHTPLHHFHISLGGADQAVGLPLVDCPT